MNNTITNGIQYAADYSDNNINRSLVEKIYINLNENMKISELRERNAYLNELLNYILDGE